MAIINAINAFIYICVQKPKKMVKKEKACFCHKNLLIEQVIFVQYQTSILSPLNAFPAKKNKSLQMAFCSP